MTDIQHHGLTGDDLITIRLPKSSWNGIVNGLEKWTGLSQFVPEMKILSDYEVIDPPSYAAWDREIRALAAKEYAEQEDDEE